MNMIIHPQDISVLQQTNEQFYGSGLSKYINWQQMTDEQLQQYENQLLSLYQELDPQSSMTINTLYSQQTINQRTINSYHFKDLFFDSLQGKQHQILTLGSMQSNQKYQKLQHKILKQLAFILFKICEDQKAYYPHLLTHIKEQFYKPNILSDLNSFDHSKPKYFELINIFFNQTLNYQQFITVNPQFQEICVLVLKKIATEEKKGFQKIQNQKFIDIQTKPFILIEKICRKFLIEINYFGYLNPLMQMIVIGNEQRFIFVKDSDFFFVLKLQKFQLLNIRRKSSHNISIHNNANVFHQSNKPKHKKNSWNQSVRMAHFGQEKLENQNQSFYLLNTVNDDEVSNYDSSFIKSQSKANQVSDQSTPKFKNSSIAHVRKKSHKDSFGGVDFDNLVYKDLSNPKRHMEQKIRQKNLQNNFSHVDKSNKKVFSQRFETNQIGSLTCGQEIDSEIEFLPHFHIGQNIENQKSMSLYLNTPNSPAYSNHNFENFSSFPFNQQFQSPKNILIKRMKGSNIQKISQAFNHQNEPHYHQPNFKLKSSNEKQFDVKRQKFRENRVLATSEIIKLSEMQKNNIPFYKKDEIQQNQDFLIIPSLNSRKQIKNQGFQGTNLSSIPHKQVFMSFSKNDKQKFIIPDLLESDSKRTYNIKDQIKFQSQSSQNLEGNKIHKLSIQQNSQNETKSLSFRQYNFRTKKEEREKYRIKHKMQFQLQSLLSQKSVQEKNQNDNSLNKHHKTHSTYENYHYTSQKNVHIHFQSTEEIKKSQCFINQNSKQNLKIQRKHSSNIPVFQTVQSPQETQPRKNPEINFVNTKREVIKRFQENSVRFSQILDNQDDQIFYIQTKNQRKQGFGTKKQRKVTDIYQGPLVNIKRNENRTSQVIQNSREREISNQSNNFQSNLNVNKDQSNILINSGGGKNYSVLSNISYDQQKRLQDLLEIQNHLINKNNLNQSSRINQDQNLINYNENYLDFANFQAIQRLIFKKKQQKNKLQTDLINISINNQNKVMQEPQNWIKKQIFYFFEPSSGQFLAPVKKIVINNKNRQKQHSLLNKSKKITINNRTFNKNDEKEELINSSTSLHNFSIKTNQICPQQFARQSFDQNKNFFQRKYSTQQIRHLGQSKNQCQSRNQGKINTQSYLNEKYETVSNLMESKSDYYQSQIKQTNNNIRPIHQHQQTFHQLSTKTIKLSQKRDYNYVDLKSQKYPKRQNEYLAKEYKAKVKFSWGTANNQSPQGL